MWFTPGMLLVYGASGYTGRKIVKELARRGVPFGAGGRDAAATRGALEEVGVSASEVRAFGLDNASELARGLSGARVVLNCAGPFERTAAPLARASIDAGAHYLDLAGEVNEHEAVRALAEEAKRRGVMLLPGVGFGCVPTELAAAAAVKKLGSPATELVIAYETIGGASKGTLETVLRGIHRPGVQRREGRLVAARPGEGKQRLDLGGGHALVLTNPWRADLIAAHVSTGVPNISTLATFPLPARVLMANPRFTDSSLGRWLTDRIIRSAPSGPSDKELAAGRTRVLAVANGAHGERASVGVHGPEAYVFTARLAACVVEAVLAGGGGPVAGYAVPLMVLSLADIERLEGVKVIS
jgi:short subunit dehydrogenase-like uncharacterized protein